MGSRPPRHGSLQGLHGWTFPLSAIVLVCLSQSACSRSHRVHAGDASEPTPIDAMDAGAKPTRDPLDAGFDSPAWRPQDASVDAVATDAQLQDADSFPDRDDAGIAPPNDPATLVFVRLEGDVRSLYAVDLRKPGQQRKLDPQVTQTPSKMRPLGYSPDGTRLLIAEYRLHEAGLYVSYRCRQQPCRSEAERLHLLARVPKSPTVRGPLSMVSEPTFALDGRGALIDLALGSDLQLRTYHVPLPDGGPGEPSLVAGAGGAVRFISRGRYALVASSDQPLRLVDLRAQPGGPDTFAVHDADGNDYDQDHLRTIQVSPEGEYFVLGERVYTVAGLVTGQSRGRSLLFPASSPRVAEHWLMYQSEDRLIAERPGGERSLVLADNVRSFHSCGERLIVERHDTGDVRRVALMGLPDPEPSSPAPLETSFVMSETAWANGWNYTTSCSHWALWERDRGLFLVNLASGEVLHGEALEDDRFSPHRWRSGLSASPDGRYVRTSEGVWHTDGAKQASIDEGLVHPTGVLRWAADGSFAVTTDPQHVGLFRLDLRNGVADRRRRLGPEPAIFHSLTLTPSGIHVAYEAVSEHRPLPADQHIEGVWETNLDTGESVRITPPTTEVAGGVEHLEWVPGDDGTLLVRGRYDAARRRTVALLDVHSGQWVPQLPPGSPVLPDRALAPGELPLVRNGRLWLSGTDEQGRARWIQPLRKALSDPWPPRQRIAVRSRSHGLQAYDPELGIFHGPDQNGALLRHDLSSGESSVLLERGGRAQNAIDGQIWISAMRDDNTIDGYLLRREQPDTLVEIVRGAHLLTQLSNDGRWLVYSKGTQREVYVADLQRGIVHDLGLSRRDDGVSPELFRFQGSIATILPRNGGCTRRRLDLERPSEVEVVRDPWPCDDVIAKSDSRAVVRVDGRLRLYEGGDSQVLNTDGIEIDESATMSPDGRWLAVRVANESQDRWRLWDLDHPTRPSRPLAGSSYSRVRFDPQGHYLVGYQLRSEVSSLTAWSVRQPGEPRVWNGVGALYQVLWVPTAEL